MDATRVTTVGQAIAALVPYPPVTLDIACAQLGIRPLLGRQPEVLLELQESLRLDRLVRLLDSATDGTGEGYVGVLWTMGRCAALDGSTPIEACQHEGRAEDAMAALRREQDRLFGG